MVTVKVTLRALSLTAFAAVVMSFGTDRAALAQMFAFQDSSNQLQIYNGSVMPPTGHYMKPGTVPSQVVTFNGEYYVGYQGSNGDFWLDANGTYFYDSNGAMAAGTSPSITILSGRLAFGFQGTNGELWISLGGLYSGFPTGAYLASGTSPSVAALPNGNLATAFHGSNGDFWVNMNASVPKDGQNTKGLMWSGTSGSIAPLPNSEIFYAFQGSDENLWGGEGDGVGGGIEAYALQPATSPSVATDAANDTFVAWQYYYGVSQSIAWESCRADGNCAYGSDNCYMWNTASPTVVFATGNIADQTLNYEIAYKGTNGDLWIDTPQSFCQDQHVAMN